MSKASDAGALVTQQEPATPTRIGRPSKYTPKLAEAICERLAQGESLNSICRTAGMPSDTRVRQWALDDREGFSAMYERARTLGYEAIADQLLDISDDARNDWMEQHGKSDAGWAANGENALRSRLRVDTRKWLLSKLLPKKFGDKIEQQITGKDGAPLSSPTFNIAFVTPPPPADGAT